MKKSNVCRYRFVTRCCHTSHTHTHTHRGWHRYIHTHNDETTLENVGQDSCYGSMDRIDLYIDE